MRDLADAYGDGPSRVADGCSGCFGFGVCELIAGNSFCGLIPTGGLSYPVER